MEVISEQRTIQSMEKEEEESAVFGRLLRALKQAPVENPHTLFHDDEPSMPNSPSHDVSNGNSLSLPPITLSRPSLYSVPKTEPETEGATATTTTATNWQLEVKAFNTLHGQTSNVVEQSKIYEKYSPINNDNKRNNMELIETATVKEDEETVTEDIQEGEEEEEEEEEEEQEQEQEQEQEESISNQTVVEITPATSDRCPTCTLPLSLCKCSDEATTSVKATSKLHHSDAGSTDTLSPPLLGMVPGVDRFLRNIVPFDPDDEALRSITLSPSVTLYLWCRSLLRTATVVSLSIDLDKLNYQQRLHSLTNETLGWWVWCPAPTLSSSSVPVALRPLAAVSFEVFLLLVLLLQFNRNTRDYLWLRPLIGLCASICFFFDTVSILVLVSQTNQLHPHFTTMEGLIFEWSTSIATVTLLIATQITNIMAWFVAAHAVLGHDRSDDGDTDGTETVGEMSGAGAAGTGVSTYRQNQLVFVRAAIWHGAPPMPKTPMPFRVHLMSLSIVFASCASA